MIALLRHLKALPIALIVLALSASLAFGSYAPASGFSLGSTFQAGTDESAGDAGDEDANEPEDTETDEQTDEQTDETIDAGTETDENTGDSSDSDDCLTDPTGLTAEELAAMNHGSIVCWAAQQETPEGYANHGAWVSQWAHMGKAKDNAPEAAASGKTHGKSHGKSHGKAKGATEGN